MKNEGLWISIIIFGVIGLLVASLFLTPEQNKKNPVVEQTVPPTETVETTSLPEGWKEYDGGDFTITAPNTWIFEKSLENYSLKSNATADSDTITINITKIEKAGKTLEEISSLFSSAVKDSAYASRDHFVETPEAVFRLTARTTFTEKTETLMLVAEQVIKTFKIK
ncbi:MAG: hypothetical protein WC702_02895 [Patescibacteria group bacterium]|jgi:hypothetical protein